MTSLARATAVMTLGTIVSRITGVAKLAAIAAAIGLAETRFTDTYNLANTAPNIIYELVLGGVLTSVFVPVIVELFEKEGRERAWEVTSAIINLSLVVLGAITILGILGAPLIAKLYTFRLGGEAAVRQQEVLTFLLRLFIPQIIFYSLTALTAGILNTHKRFGAPMYTPILNNIAVIIIFIAFSKAYGAVTLDTVTTEQLWVIGLGTTGGIVLMAIAQLPFLRGIARYRFTFSPRHPSIRKLAGLSTFVVGYVVANQIGYLIVQVLANAEQGAYSAYLAAFTFFILPHGLFSVSVTTALLPDMSAHAANKRWADFTERVSTGMRATFFLILPASVAFLILGKPIIRVLLERGVMTGLSTELVSDVLRFFLVGLVPFSLFQLFSRAFYAMQDTKTPFLVNCAAVALNTAVNIPMFAWLGPEGLAAGHALAYIFGSIIQGRLLSRRIGGLDGRRVYRSALRTGAASAVMGVAVYAAYRLMDTTMGSASTVGEILIVAVPVAVGTITYLAVSYGLKVEEIALMRGVLSRRLRPEASNDA
ncbi:MAG TPA: murein biosynthesis integral membrane protein MurJ [Actinomycetota bacterium]|nr:murein biosynthesis integral membrane protein MurJ [Actinomycetota bacterium]